MGSSSLPLSVAVRISGQTPALSRLRESSQTRARENGHEQARRIAAQRQPRLGRGAGRRQRRRHDRGDGRGRRRIHLLHLGLGDRLLPGGGRQGARPRPQGAEADHRHPRAREPERRARLRRGERQARGDGGACRLRHAALRRRGAHRVPLRPARGDHRRRLADQLSRQLPRRARRRRAHLAAAELRPERHRAAVHQVGPPHGAAGQRRADDLARVAGGAHRAVRAGLSDAAARGVAAQGQGREVSDHGSAWRREARRARRRRHPRDRAAAGQGGQSVRAGGALGPQSGDRAGAGDAVRIDGAAGRAIGPARLPVLPAQPSALHERREPQGRRRGAGARRRHSLARRQQSAAGQRLGGDDRRRAGQAPHPDHGVHRRSAADRRRACR